MVQEHSSQAGCADLLVRADLIVGTARIPVALIDLSKENAAIELRHRLCDIAGASLHIHGIGRLPIAHHKTVAERYCVLRFAETSPKLRRRLYKHLETHQTLVGPAMRYLLSHS